MFKWFSHLKSWFKHFIVFKSALILRRHVTYTFVHSIFQLKKCTGGAVFLVEGWFFLNSDYQIIIVLNVTIYTGKVGVSKRYSSSLVMAYTPESNMHPPAFCLHFLYKVGQFPTPFKDGDCLSMWWRWSHAESCVSRPLFFLCKHLCSWRNLIHTQPI